MMCQGVDRIALTTLWNPSSQRKVRGRQHPCAVNRVLGIAVARGAGWASVCVCAFPMETRSVGEFQPHVVEGRVFRVFRGDAPGFTGSDKHARLCELSNKLLLMVWPASPACLNWCCFPCFTHCVETGVGSWLYVNIPACAFVRGLSGQVSLFLVQGSVAWHGGRSRPYGCSVAAICVGRQALPPHMIACARASSLWVF